MSWIENVIFHSRSAPIGRRELQSLPHVLSNPLSAAEIESLEILCRNSVKVDFREWKLPNYKIPSEYIDLLKYSCGGLLCNGNREFGFFGPKEIREYYLNYMFPEYLPEAVPVGLNGGGVFYAYDFRSAENRVPIIATPAGALDWDESILLGYSLEEVFSKSTSIEDEF